MTGEHNSSALSAQLETLLPTGLQIVAVSLRQLEYEEVPRAGEEDTPEGQDFYEINGAIDIRPPDLVQVAVKFKLKPNVKHRPIKLSCVMSATFRRGQDIDMDAMAEFIRVRSHLILFPYVRELVSSVTGRGVYGGLYLNPVVLPPMMEAEEMKEYMAGLSPSGDTGVTSGPDMKPSKGRLVKKKLHGTAGAATPEG